MPIKPTPREQHRRKRHLEIVMLAFKTVRDEGIDALSMNKLARALGFTPGALYRYFTSKEALIGEIALKVLDDIQRVIEKETGGAAKHEPLAYVLAVCDAYSIFAERSPGAFGFVSVLLGDPRVLVDNADVAAEVAQKLFALMHPLTTALDDAASNGTLVQGDSTTRALSLFVSLHGALLLRKQERHAFFPIKVDALRQEVVRTLLLGWKTPRNEILVSQENS